MWGLRGVLVVLLAAAAGCGAGGGRSAAPGAAQPSLSVTYADRGTMYSLRPGQRLTLALLPNLDWSIQDSAPAVLAPVPGSTGPGRAGTYRALRPGTARLQGSGRPICRGEQACPMFILGGFTITAVVRAG